MQDLVIFMKCLHPDGTVALKRARLPAEGAFELRLRFHDGKLAKALLLRGLRLSEEGRQESSDKGNACTASRSAAPVGVAQP